MHEGPDLSTTPPVPAQRVPAHDTLPAAPPESSDTAESTPPEPDAAEETTSPDPSESALIGSEQTGPDAGGPPVTGPIGDLGIGAPPKAKWRMRALLAGGAAIAVLVAGFL